MKCDDIHNQLADYLGGELQADLAEQMDAHLATCPVCREEKASLQEALRLMSQLSGPVGMPASRAAELPTPWPRSGGWRRVMPYAAMLVLGMGIGWLTKPTETSPDVQRPMVFSDDGSMFARWDSSAGWLNAAHLASSDSNRFARNWLRFSRALSHP